MTQFLHALTVLVPDYDEAIAFYIDILGFTLCEDTQLSEDKRWVTVAPPGCGPHGCKLLLARAASADQILAMGNQAGGRVFLFLKTDNFDQDYQNLQDLGVDFCETPRMEDYGKVAVFKDPFGNRWDLLEDRQS